MPSTYTHYSLSKEVLKQLPDHLYDICKKYEAQFQMGAQGPDFFYFYRPIRHNTYTRMGKQIHDTSFDELLTSVLPVLKEYGTNSPEYAYILGFITHFTLDSIAHPYVIPQVKKLKFRHTAMETEFDRCLLMSQGENPYKYPVWNAIPKDRKTVLCVSHMFPDIPFRVIFECLHTYYFYKRAYRTPNRVRYYLVKLWFMFRRRKEFFGNLLFTFEERPKARITNPELMIRYQLAIKESLKNIELFHQDFIRNHPLDETFHRNFK